MTSSTPGAPGNFRGLAFGNFADQFMKRFPDATPEQLTEALSAAGGLSQQADDFSGLTNIVTQQGVNQQNYLTKLAEIDKQRTKDAQEIAKDSAKTAFQYEMMGRIPDTIFASLAGSGQLMREGAKDISNTVMRGVEALPKPNIQARAYQNPTFRYFSGK